MDDTSLDDKPPISARSPLSAILAACGELSSRKTIAASEEETMAGKDIVKDMELSVSPAFILDAGR
jgi:hypothetical protein